MSSAHKKALVRQWRREITVCGAIALLLFGGAQLLPLGAWLQFVVQHESSQLPAFCAMKRDIYGR